jgi:hypothetical protein
MIKADDIAYVRFSAPDLDQMEAFLNDFGMVRAARDEKTLYMRGEGSDPFLHVTHKGDPGFAGVAFRALSIADLEKLETGASILIDGEAITIADIEIKRSSKGDKPTISAHQLVSIEVDATLNEDQILEGLSREVMRKIQQARKNADLKLDARIELSLFVDGKLLEAVKAHESTLTSETLTKKLTYAASAESVTGTHTEVATDIEEGKVGIGLKVV